MTAKSARNSTGTPIMPALPPQEHVPFLISNPLGTLLAQSVSYRRWLNAGAIVALFFPIALVMVYIVHGNIDAARVVARPLFVLCCQIITETVSKRNLVRGIIFGHRRSKLFSSNSFCTSLFPLFVAFRANYRFRYHLEY
tara:strand:- start:129 stop:548 length:420 start_codon:yes stop_codon:yes gene_type:complete